MYSILPVFESLRVSYSFYMHIFIIEFETNVVGSVGHLCILVAYRLNLLYHIYTLITYHSIYDIKIKSYCGDVIDDFFLHQKLKVAFINKFSMAIARS